MRGEMFDRLDEAVVVYNKEYNELGGHALLLRYDKGHSGRKRQTSV